MSSWSTTTISHSWASRRRASLFAIIVPAECGGDAANLRGDPFGGERLRNPEHVHVERLELCEHGGRAHVVLADFWMPGMNGLEMTDLIRRWDENNDRYTGIVLLTAEDTTSSIVVAFDRGVDDFISKSANQFELAARVFGAGRTAYQQNELREKMRSISGQFMRMKQYSLQDPETNLPNRAQLENHIESLIEHSHTRGGGLGVGDVVPAERHRLVLRVGDRFL